MNEFAAVVLLPLTILAIAVGMALSLSEPMWLVFGAVLAIAASYIARRTFGS